MEYHRHSDRLVLGFLKNNCFSAYRAFLKHNFVNQGTHINTRVAGQSLEDILRIYSRIFEIVQGRIEDTNYPIEHGSEKLSPIFLAEQLLYLLDHPPPSSFHRSRRTSTESSVTESHFVDNDGMAEQLSDVETTPENSLPGNVGYHSNQKSNNDRSPLRRKSMSPRSEKVIVNKEVLSEVMSEKLLQNTEFQQKLANTITTVLNSPVTTKKYCDTATAELDSTIRNVLQKTEADPMFEEVLQEFLDGPHVNPSSKAVPSTASSRSSSEHLVINRRSVSNCHSSMLTDRGSEGSDLNETPKKNISLTNEVPITTNNLMETPFCPTSTSDIISTMNQPMPTANASSNNPIYINSTRNGLFVVPQSYYVISQPISMPNCQPVLMPAIESPQIVDLNSSVPPGHCADSGTPTNQTEARNIQEYLTMYDDGKPSPIVKQQPARLQTGLKKVIYPRKKSANLQPRPTVKVEILHVRADSEKVPSSTDPEPGTSQSDSSTSITDKNMPQIHQPNLEIIANPSNDVVNLEIRDSNAKKINSNTQEQALSDPKLITPSPSITTVNKRTPRSGSHVRNLTFPSPVKDSRMSRSSDAKLCAERTVVQPDPMSLPICWDAGLRMFVDPIIPKKNEQTPKSPKKKKTLKKVAKATELNVTDVEGQKLTNATELNLTDVKEKKITNATELNVTDVEGKMLEEALKTPKDTKKYGKNNTQQNDVVEVESNDGKKVLSPSKLNASKRNLLYKAQIQEEETPLKNFPITPGIKTNETPFTPMLQANLKEITGGDIFSIDTPNFPVTPGLSFMASSTNYYIFQDEDQTSTNEIKKSNEDKVAKIEENKKRKNEETLENKTKKRRTSPKKKSTPKTPKKSTPRKSATNKSSTIKKKTEHVENENVRKRQTRSTVLSKLKISKASNSPRNDSDDQYNFFKASGTNLHRKRKQSQKDDTVAEKSPQNIQNEELHMALMNARQDFTVCRFPEESYAYVYDESSIGTRMPCDASILDKKRKVTVFSAQDDEIKIILSATKFSSLLDICESENGHCSKGHKENSCGQPLAVRSAKRRSRSDSNSSHHSASAKKREGILAVDTHLLKDVNINSFLTRIHGHEPEPQS